MKSEHIAIIILLVIILWFGATIIRLENYHYGAKIGICNNASATGTLYTIVEKDECLNNTQTRTNPIWNLLYGLGILK